MTDTNLNDIVLGKQLTEHFTDFTDETLIDRKPVANWPCLLGTKAGEIINEQGGVPLKVLVVHGGVGRTTLELLRSCKNLNIDHSDPNADNLNILKSLLSESQLKWNQQLEGQIVEAKEYKLNETQDTLLDAKNNSVSYWKSDYKNLDTQMTGYDVIVADFRYKDSASHLDHILKRLKPGGILIQGTIDDPNDANPGLNHSLQVLAKKCTQIPQNQDSPRSFPHIYRQTRNKHQYAISHFSAWTKDADESGDSNAGSSKNEDFQETIQTTADYYEDQSILESYDRFHFGEGLLSVKNFPLRMAEVCIEACRKYGNKMETGT